MRTTSMVLLSVLLGFSSIKAQMLNEKPNSNWPFLFSDFSDCVIYHKDSTVSKVNANYNLLSQEIQFNKQEEIMTLSSPEDVLRIKFNEYTMMPDDKAFYFVLNDLNANIVMIKKLRGNYNDIVESKGAYGSSTSSAAVKNQSDLNIGGVNNMSIRVLKKNKEGGKTFRINDYYYFMISDSKEIQNLKKKTLLKALDSNKTSASKYIKEYKINFKKDEDVIQLGQFLNSL